MRYIDQVDEIKGSPLATPNDDDNSGRKCSVRKGKFSEALIREKEKSNK